MMDLVLGLWNGIVDGKSAKVRMLSFAI